MYLLKKKLFVKNKKVKVQNAFGSVGNMIQKFSLSSTYKSV